MITLRTGESMKLALDRFSPKAIVEDTRKHPLGMSIPIVASLVTLTTLLFYEFISYKHWRGGEILGNLLGLPLFILWTLLPYHMLRNLLLKMPNYGKQTTTSIFLIAVVGIAYYIDAMFFEGGSPSYLGIVLGGAPLIQLGIYSVFSLFRPWQ